MSGHFHEARDDFVVSTDPAWRDMDFVFTSLRSTEWGAEWSREIVDEAFARSLAFGVFTDEPRRQVGFARVVTDGVTFSWVCDVFVAPEYRGRGLGKWLVGCVVAHPAVKHTRSTLGTRDAHGLYERFGFRPHDRMVRPADPRP